MASGNFLYPWARNSFLASGTPLTLSWTGSTYKVMLLNAGGAGGGATWAVWSASGATGYAWNPVLGTIATAPYMGAGYAITYLSQIPNAHRTFDSITGTANSLGILSALTRGNGIADASTASTTAYSVTAGRDVSAFVIYKSNGGADTADPLIAYFDSAIGMPVTANGGDITIVWDTYDNRIFKL